MTYEKGTFDTLATTKKCQRYSAVAVGVLTCFGRSLLCVSFFVRIVVWDDLEKVISRSPRLLVSKLRPPQSLSSTLPHKEWTPLKISNEVADIFGLVTS
jgi:hypothetical protein